MSRTSNHIFLVRHARPDLPDMLPRFLGHVDPPLCEDGLSQAKSLSRALKNIDFSAAYSSDLKRAVQTANAITEGRDLQLNITDSLREINPGICDGYTLNDAFEKFPYIKTDREKDMFNYRIPGGESFADLEARIWPVFLKIAQATVGNTLMVCHSGVNKVILRRILQYSENKLFSIEQSYCGINIIAIHPKKGFTLKAVNWNPSLELILK